MYPRFKLKDFRFLNFENNLNNYAAPSSPILLIERFNSN